MLAESLGLVVFVAVTGLIHGAEPGHGWPVAAAYAFGTDSPWRRGLAAAFVLGVGHLVSSVVVVLGFFWLKGAAGLDTVPYLDYVAGGLLIALGIREYVTGGHHHADGEGPEGSGADAASADGTDVGLAGPATAGAVRLPADDTLSDGGHEHTHAHGDLVHTHPHEHPHAHGEGQAHTREEHTHGHGDHAHDDGEGHDHAHDDGEGHAHGGLRWRVLSALGLSGHHLTEDDAVGGGLAGIAWTAFVLGFAHEEEFELIGICTGTALCVELTLLYAACVVFALVALTAVLLAGYERYEQRVERYAEHFPTLSAAVLVAMGLGFIAGVF